MSSLNAIRLSKSGRRMLISGLESALLNSGKVKETFLLGELIILTRRSAARNVGLVPLALLTTEVPTSAHAQLELLVEEL